MEISAQGLQLFWCWWLHTVLSRNDLQVKGIARSNHGIKIHHPALQAVYLLNPVNEADDYELIMTCFALYYTSLTSDSQV